MTQTPDDFLAHYGVLGMRWGRRKGSSGSSNSAEKPATSADAARAAATRKKSLSELSDDDIQAFTKRLDLEKRYKELTAEKSALDGYHAKVKKFLDYGDTAARAYKLYKSDAGQAAVEVIKRSLQAKTK